MKKFAIIVLFLMVWVMLPGCGKKDKEYKDFLFEKGFYEIFNEDTVFLDIIITELDLYPDVNYAVVVNTKSGDVYKYGIDIDNPAEKVDKAILKRAVSDKKIAKRDYKCKVEHGTDYYLITLTQQ